MSDETMEELQVRKKPEVKKRAAKKKAAAVEIPVVAIEEPEFVKTVTMSSLFFAVTIAIAVSSIVGYQFGKTSNSTPVATSNTSTFTDVVAGKVALSESELIAAVKKLGISAYWAGPVKGAKYTLSVPADGQAYIRYLPNGQGLADTNPNYVVIATYKTTNAFSATQAAANQTSGITFVNTDGAAVYYSKSTPTNVYVAFPGKDFQIEIFDPIAKTALEIASKSGAVRLVA